MTNRYPRLPHSSCSLRTSSRSIRITHTCLFVTTVDTVTVSELYNILVFKRWLTEHHRTVLLVADDLRFSPKFDYVRSSKVFDYSTHPQKVLSGRRVNGDFVRLKESGQRKENRIRCYKDGQKVIIN